MRKGEFVCWEKLQKCRDIYCEQSLKIYGKSLTKCECQRRI